MTKANNLPHKTPNLASYHAEVKKNALQFEHILKDYTTAPPEQKTRLKNSLGNHLALIEAALKEIPTKELHKHSEKLAKDYHQYLEFPSIEHFSALRQDIETLKEYNEI